MNARTGVHLVALPLVFGLCLSSLVRADEADDILKARAEKLPTEKRAKAENYVSHSEAKAQEREAAEAVKAVLLLDDMVRLNNTTRVLNGEKPADPEPARALAREILSAASK